VLSLQVTLKPSRKQPFFEAERVGDDDVAALVWAARQRHADASSPISGSALFQGQSGGYNQQQQQQLLTWT